MSQVYGPRPLKRYEPVERNLRIDHHRSGAPYEVFWKRQGVVHMVTLGDESNPKPQRGIGIREARKERDKVMGTDVLRERPTETVYWLEMWDAYYADRTNPNVQNPKYFWKEQTRAAYKSKWKNHISGKIPARTKARDITTAHIEKILRDEQALGHDTGQTYALLSGMFRYALKKKWIAINPVLAVEESLLPVSNADIEEVDRTLQTLSSEELQRVVSKLEGQWRKIVLVALKTGMRISEVVGLTFAQVDGTTLCVDRQLRARISASDPKTWHGPAKTVKGKRGAWGDVVTGMGRRLALAEDVLSIIREQRKLVLASGLAASGLVFPSKNGTPVQRDDVRDHFAKALTAAGVERDLDFHNLRHTYASSMFEEGASYEEVALDLGITVDTCKKVYVHWESSGYREQIRRERYGRSKLASIG